jgi:hypothetical protein
MPLALCCDHDKREISPCQCLNESAVETIVINAREWNKRKFIAIQLCCGKHDSKQPNVISVTSHFFSIGKIALQS